jgi:preprotein translocase subunit SecA
MLNRPTVSVAFRAVFENFSSQTGFIMRNQTIKSSTRLSRYLRRLNGCTMEYDCRAYEPILRSIKKLAEGFANASDEELKGMSSRLVSRARGGEQPGNMLVEGYAVAAESVRRTLGFTVFDEQILCAIVLNAGKCAEMQTGEGKTLAAVLPAYLNALSGKGAHVLTFNDYLAKRDAEWMGPAYRFLGLSVGCVQDGMDADGRKAAYGSDVTYVTAKEAGFDFLRDGLSYSEEGIVQRAFHYAIVDEADSILVDEARVPLVIAGDGPAGCGGGEAVREAAGVAARLEKGTDFEFDDYARNVHLTAAGERRAEGMLGCGNLYAGENFDRLCRLNLALHALHLLHADEDYIVRDGRVELVDEFTGRVADKRRWPDGLQAAVEAKEGLHDPTCGSVLNSITLRHFIGMYPKLAGMTATAQAAEEELRRFYRLHVTVVPPHKPCGRVDYPDRIFSTKQAKQRALVDEIAAAHAAGRPVLVGTRTVRESDALAADLERSGIACRVLNARNDALEAAIVAEAGALCAVTISTNMAGRGTDIRLGGATGKDRERVAALGGLYVIGTNRHESLRIDGQLRGRAGRQGDPGSSRFFISLADDLFVKYRLADLLPARRAGTDERGEIDDPVLRAEINRVQRIIEGQNTEIKTTLQRYSHLVEKQRGILAEKRRRTLRPGAAFEAILELDPASARRCAAALGNREASAACTSAALSCIDRHWSRHLSVSSDIREGIHLRRMGGQDPLYEYQKLIIVLFDDAMAAIAEDTLAECRSLASGGPGGAGARPHGAPSATWTYVINDNPFDPMLEIELKGNIGLSAWAGLLWPLTGLYFLVKKIKNRKEKKLIV